MEHLKVFHSHLSDCLFACLFVYLLSIVVIIVSISERLCQPTSGTGAHRSWRDVGQCAPNLLQCAPTKLERSNVAHIEPLTDALVSTPFVYLFVFSLLLLLLLLPQTSDDAFNKQRNIILHNNQSV